MRSSQTKELVAALEKSNSANMQSLKKVPGKYDGTYACKEFVYAYAMWISPKFHLAVIRAFDQQQIPADSFSAPLERAIEQRAQALSLKHYQRIKEQLQALII